MAEKGDESPVHEDDPAVAVTGGQADRRVLEELFEAAFCALAEKATVASTPARMILRMVSPPRELWGAACARARFIPPSAVVWNGASQDGALWHEPVQDKGQREAAPLKSDAWNHE